MRLKIRARDSDHLQMLRRIAEQQTRVYVESKERLFISTGNLSDEVKDWMTGTGARITTEQAYQIDCPVL